jgi:catecholate siderophore receptor
MAADQSSSSSSASSPSPRKISSSTSRARRRRWTALGTVVASATVGAKFARPVHAEGRVALDPSVDRVAWLAAGSSVRFLPWEDPQAVIASRLALSADAAAPADVAAADADQNGANLPDARPRTFAIAASPLADALAAFSKATGVEVAISPDLTRGIVSGGVTGSHAIVDALRTILDGSGLTFRFDSPVHVSIDLRVQGQSVNVNDTAPIVSSSPKYTEPLRDTPQTVVVIPTKVIEEQAATSLRDALRNTPGITLTAGEGGTAPGDNLLIRGFSARNDVYVDGARDGGVVSRDTFNTEAVEVAKGPSSVVTGRGATGGSVNIVSKAANLGDAVSGRFAGGSADSGRGTFDVNHRLGATSGLRLNAMWQDEGVPRRDEVRNRSWGVAPSLALGLGTPTEVTFGYEHLQQNNVPDYGLPATLPSGAVAEGITVDDLDFSNFYGLVSRDHEKVKTDLGTVTVEHRFSAATSLRNLTRYGRNDLDRVVTPPRAATASSSDADPGFDDSGFQRRRTDTKYQYRTDATFVNQTDLTLRRRTGGLAHAFVAGMELSHESQPSYAVTDTFANGRPPVTDLFHPDPDQNYVPALARTGASSDGAANSTAFYAFDTIKTAQRWQADLGLRWDRVAVDYDNVATDASSTRYTRTDRAFSGRAGLVFKPTEAGSIYAAYSTSFNPSFDGSFGLSLVNRNADLSNLPPERTHNVEVGTKWDLRPGLAFTTALFHTEKTNAKTVDDAGATVLAGDQRVQGVELSLAGALTSRWDVFAGLSLMDSKVVDSGTVGEVGRQLAYVPKTAFNVWSAYRLPGLAVTLGAGAQFTDGYFFNNTNSSSSENADAIQALTRYWLFSAMASWDVTPHIALQVNGTNLSNARYVDRGYSGHFIPGPGRGVMIGPSFKF